MEKYTTDLQPFLKKLPVPSLAHTSQELLVWLEGVATDEEHADFARATQKFVKEVQVQTAQKILEDKAAHQTDSWLADWWQASYLDNRAALQTSSNIALNVADEHINQTDSPAELMASIVVNLSYYYYQLISGRLPLEKTSRGDYVDMSFFQRFFASKRIAQSEQDSFVSSLPRLADAFIIFIYREHFYRIPIANQKGQLFSFAQLSQLFVSLIDTETTEGPPIASISGIDREESATLWQEVCQEEQNRANVQLLTDSLFTISYTEYSSRTSSQQMKDALVGRANHLFDKTMQIFVNQDKQVSFSFEHSSIDGVPALLLVTEAFKPLVKTIVWSTEPPQAQKLTWQLPSETTRKIAEASRQVAQLATSLVVRNRPFMAFGKDTIKQLGVSPDAFFQFALNLATHRLFGSPKSIYEPVAMRAFYQGRTESARSLNPGKIKFVEAFDQSDGEPTKLADAFTEGIAEHVRRTKECQQGQGVERHLFGLEKVLKQMDPTSPTLAFFAEPLLQTMQADFISSTGIPFSIMNAFTFAPTNPQGYGIYYGILDDKILLTCSAWNRATIDPTAVTLAIHQALNDLYQWCVQRNQSNVSGNDLAQGK